MHFKNTILICLGWISVALGFMGAFLPILPTTPFLILALSLFAKSSPRFHQMLLNNRWFGQSLQQWESNKTMSKKAKFRAIALVIGTFGVSIYWVRHNYQLQLMLLVICCILLSFMLRIPVSQVATKTH